jgi:hypothetical protein
MLRPLLIAASVIASLTACSSASTPSASVAATPIPAPAPDQAAYLREMRKSPALNPATTDESLIAVGNSICTSIGVPGITHEVMDKTMSPMFPGTSLGSDYVYAAEKYLCPAKNYLPVAQVPAPAPAVSAPIATPAPLAPATAISAHDWQLIAKDPASHAGQRIIVYGHVGQFDSATGSSGFLANVDGVVHKPQYGYANYPTNTALAGDPVALHDVVKGDLFTAEVTVEGLYTYPTTMGGQASVPKLSISKLTVTGHTTN